MATATAAARRGLWLAGRTTSFGRRNQLFVSNKRWFASYPPHEVVGMPSLSPTMESGSIASWNLNEGDSFAAGDVFCEVETDKATVSFEAQDDGVLAKILAQAGPAEINCGEPILITVEEESDVAAFKDYVVEATTTTTTAAAPPAAAAEPEPATPEPAAAPPPPPPPAAPVGAAPTPALTDDRVIASPLAHMLAKEMGHDLSTISGTGPGGRIIAADVKEFVPAETPTAAATAAVTMEQPQAPAQMTPAAPPIVGTGFTDYPLSESAKQVAAQLTHSKQNVPHYYLTVDIAMDELLQIRSTLNATLDQDNQIGVYEIMLKAAGAAMKTVPAANASWMDTVVRMYDSVDINVAIGNGDELYTPVIRNVASRGVKSISQDLQAAMAALEQDETTTTDDNQEVVEFAAMGTFTVLNLGMYGIKSCAPIIREPQACALALGALENRIVPSDNVTEDDDELYKESVMLTATLSCDHRVVDGAVGAQWLSAFKSHVENPTTLLL